MKRETPGAYVVALYVSDLLATVLSLILAQVLRRVLPYGQPFEPYGGGLNLAVGMMAIAIWTITFRWLSAYNPNRTLRVADEMATVIAAICVAALLLAGALFLTYRGLSRLLFLYFFALDVALILLFRTAVRFALKALRLRQDTVLRVLVVGAGEIGRQTAGLLSERAWMGLQVVGFLDDDPDKAGRTVNGVPVLGALSQAPAIVQEHGIHEVIIALPLHAHEQLRTLVSRLNEMSVNVGVVPDLFPLAYLRPTIGVLGDMPLVVLKEPVLSGTMFVAKRVLDLVVAVCALLLLWPVMLVTAVAIRLDSPGPAIFRQLRMGWHGRLFTMYKFRTMVVGAENNVDVILAQTEEGKRFLRKDISDPRITRVGRQLRRWSVDELPQLFNVLKGEMSIVGPRPDLPSLAQDYEPWQRKRFSVPPGMTGWWQVTGRSEKPSTLHTEEDLYYIRNYSLLLDLQILFRTLGAVLRGKGAY